MRRLIFRLFISLIVFTIVLIVLISAYNQQVFMRDIKSEQQQAWNLVESHIITDMQTVDKSHLFFDTTYSAEMERELYTLRDYYNTNPDIYTWDLEEMKAHTGMEIFVINNQNKIIVATHTLSIDFDFNECCERFAKLLDERRMSDAFFSDGLENSVITKKLAKYGYLSTSDHQYILGIGGEVSELPLFQEFNFYNSIEQLTKKYEDLMNICVINYEGLFLEWHGDYRSIDDFPDDLRQAYEATVLTNVPTEVVHALENDRKLTNRFVPYEAEFTSGPATKRIIYFQFSNDLELALLKRNMQRMFVALAFGILIACFMLAIIIKILLTTLRRATYDTLTGIYNRASYLDYMEKMLQSKSSHPVGLLLIDIDNFKYINDHFGHIEGDAVLKELGQILKPIAKMHFPVRFGGDEFAIVISRASEEKLERYATNLLEAVRKKRQYSDIWRYISVSIGGAFQQQNQETEVSLFMRADQALYTSKHQGKDCYTLKAIEN